MSETPKIKRDTAPQARSQAAATDAHALVALAVESLNHALDSIEESMTTVRHAPRVLESPMHAQAIRQTERAAGTMRGTLAALGDIAALAEGAAALRLAPVDLADLLMSVVGRWTAEPRGHTLELSMPGEVPALVGDAARLEQAFDQLVEMALRENAEQRPIRITIRPSEQQLVVSVRQPGPATVHPHGEAAAVSLRRALVAVVVRAHGGRIWTEADPDEDEVTHYIALPLVVPERAPEPEPQPPVAPMATTAAAAAPSTVVLARAHPLVALAESDTRMARFLRANLETQQYTVVSAADLDDLYRQIDLTQPDLVLADSAVVDAGAAANLSHLCGYAGAPVVVITPQADPLQTAHALDQGAADVVSKPLSVEELLARCRRALRSAAASHEAPESRAAEIALGDLRIDLSQHAVQVAGEAVHLSKTEFKLLRALAQHAGAVLSHETLLERVWGQGYERDVDFLWVYVRRLRRKIEPDPTKPRYIQTVPGVGYRLARGQQ